MKIKLLFALRAALLIAITMAAGTASADEIFTVTLNTMPLAVAPGTSAGPFSLAFQLVDGSQPNNNSATISDFTYGVGGSAGSAARQFLYRAHLAGRAAALAAASA